MSLKLKIEYLARIRERYYRSTKSQKTKILDELCEVSGLSRKYAIRILAKKHIEGPKKSGRKRVYSKGAIHHLKKLYLLMNQMCSKKMVAAFPTWLDFYEDEQFNHEIKEELLAMSAATIDRYLRQYKATLFRRRRSGTKPGKYLKNVIPIKSFDFKAKGPGHVEADTVAHCGNSLSGKFIWSLTFTDVYSGWTENRAIYTKHTDDVLSAIIEVRKKLPFELLSFNTDNGTEFLSRNIMMYLSNDENDRRVLFTRSRAYRKNDNCHVEQKNWTHVREIFGYERYDNEDLVPLMNEIYMKYQNILMNFFVPQLKLVEKTRIGAKYYRKYDRPLTPYQRLMNSSDLNMAQKEALRRQYMKLNPFELKRECQRMMIIFKNNINNIKQFAA